MFRTPDLHRFTVVWYLQPTQIPDFNVLTAGHFVTDRFIEDIMDGNQSISLVVEETKVPNMDEHTPGTAVPFTFTVITHESQARELIELGYKVTPVNPDAMKTDWRDEPDGMTWQELLMLINSRTRQSGVEPAWEKIVRATDDDDPDAPWYYVTGMRTDDDGIFLTLEPKE